MKPFRNLAGGVAPLDRVDVDTDQIIPKEFLKLVQRTGFGQYLFRDWRLDADGKPNPNFVLNNPKYASAVILLTRRNFGSGSSREHAVWALLDSGFGVVIASSFADIFYNNCFKNGLLPVVLSDDEVEKLFHEVMSENGRYILEVDLLSQTIQTPGKRRISFSMDSHRKNVLLEGLDDIAITLKHEATILAYEKRVNPRAVPRPQDDVSIQ